MSGYWLSSAQVGLQSSPPEAVRMLRHRVLHVPELPMDPGVIEELEKEIKACCISSSSSQIRQYSQYPLSYTHDCLPLEKAMHDELKESWDVHVNLDEVLLNISPQELRERLGNWKVLAWRI
jgi:hypothetical protein